MSAVAAYRRLLSPKVEPEFRNPTISALLRNMRVLHTGYRPPALLPSGIAQSLMAGQYAPDPSPVFRRQELELGVLDFRRNPRARTACCPEVVPAGVCSLDWLEVPDKHAPIVMLVPGLTGSSSSVYIQRAAVALHGTGARVAVFNPRSRGGVKLRSPFLYSAGYTEDLRRAVDVVGSSAGGFPGAQILGAGYSLGSSYLLKYCCEEGDACVLSGAALFACPVDCARMGDHLESSATGKLINPALVRSGATPATPRAPLTLLFRLQRQRTDGERSHMRASGLCARVCRAAARIACVRRRMVGVQRRRNPACPLQAPNLSSHTARRSLSHRSVQAVRVENESMLLRHGSVNLSLSAAAKTMRAFDDATIAPMMGTAGVDDYYAQASSSGLLRGLAVPTLFLCTANDPVCPAQIVRDVVRDALPSEPPILLAVTPEGGHSMVWPERPTGVRADGAWGIEVLCEWVTAICQQRQQAIPAAAQEQLSGSLQAPVGCA